MIKRLLFLILSFLLFISNSKLAYASGFNLKSIGNSNTNGKNITRWWYTGSKIPMSGDAVAGSTVNITVDGNKTSVTADDSGGWLYDPGALNEGDHNIVLENNGSSINFTLSLGTSNVDWEAVGKGGGESLPAAGAMTPTLISLLLGGIFLIFSRKFFKQN